MNTAKPTVFNSAQLYLLELFSTIKTEEELLEIKKIISAYYAKKMDDLLDKMWQSGELDQKRLDKINEMDLHQWLREQMELEQATN